MSERSPIQTDDRFRHAIRLICMARQTRLHAERHDVRVRRSLEQLPDEHSRAAMDLIREHDLGTHERPVRIVPQHPRRQGCAVPLRLR